MTSRNFISRSQVGLGNALLLSVVLISSFGFAAEITEQDIRDAILGVGSFSQEQLNDMDLNTDGKVDVADLVSLSMIIPNAFPQQLEGYIWAVCATFNTEEQQGTPYSYTFALKIPATKAGGPEVVPIPGFDPTRGMTQQDLSTTGEVPGARLPRNLLSDVIPAGTSFFENKTGENIVFTSSAVQIPKSSDNPRNPVNSSLTRRWTLQINEEAVLAGLADQGTILEATEGLTPQPITAIGTVLFVPFSKVDLNPLLAESDE